MSAKAKNPDILRIMREAAKNDGEFCLFAEHASERMFEQDIDYSDVFEVLLKGRHKSSRDSFDIEFEEWRYAFEHELDERIIRVIISEVQSRIAAILIVTAIDVKYGKR